MSIKKKHLGRIFWLILFSIPLLASAQEKEPIFFTLETGFEIKFPVGHFQHEYMGQNAGFHYKFFVGKEYGLPFFIGLSNTFIAYESLTKSYELFNGQFLIPVKHKATSRMYNLDLVLRVYPWERGKWLLNTDAFVGLRHTSVRSTLEDLETDNELETYKDDKDYAFAYGAAFGINRLINDYLMFSVSLEYSSSTNTRFFQLVDDIQSIDEDDPFEYFEYINTTIDYLSIEAGIKFLF